MGQAWRKIQKDRKNPEPDQENELLRVEEKYDVLEAMAFGNAEALNEIEIARLNARNEILLKFDNGVFPIVQKYICTIIKMDMTNPDRI